ncbi:differentially expressed in FDCP 8-like isoform X2 [Dreissena polymorpha]|uniref:differentially expressed in FDCP 8-like isoform X2 n=1 Tax=Dreissena polymorpha TaxID=45954 RepID=UPI0022653DF7|nr:differentially expressed in FDCP 8-like isoform X2 [Dreissena polymorpha]
MILQVHQNVRAMSSVENSDNVYSSEDEDDILATMATRSGLPQKATSIQGNFTTADTHKIMNSDTSVATVKMSGGVMRQGGSLFDSSDSEDEDLMKSHEKASEILDFNRQSESRKGTFKKSVDSLTSSINTLQSSKSGSFVSVRKASDVNVGLSNGASDGHVNDRHHSSGSNAGSDTPSSYKDTRFNPFDRDLHMEEDHFEKQKEDQLGRIKSGSNGSSSWTQPSAPTSRSSDDVTFADLGLAEDHFAQPEGCFGMSSSEELELAIETCKEMILRATKDSDKQKNLVKTLIQLRLKLQDLKEDPLPVEEGVKQVVGHKFVLSSGAGSKHYCEKCNAVIWGVLQQWYKCSECGYRAHIKCLNQITRTCASVRVQEDPVYNLAICEEQGLSAQNYRCAECRAAISYKSGFSEPRVCDYSGNYYCELCHWNDTMLIPARVLHNWDFDEWKVCRASKQFLKLMSKKAVIRIQDINPMLFSFVEELNEVKKLREELLIMKKYILQCSAAMEMKLLLQLQRRQHFVENSDIYSMQDLVDVHGDLLLPELAQVHTSWAQHIKTDCEVCRGKGFLCEICKTDEILFPFDNIAVVCADCSAVLHRHCFAKRSGACPKCERLNKRRNI